MYKLYILSKYNKYHLHLTTGIGGGTLRLLLPLVGGLTGLIFGLVIVGGVVFIYSFIYTYMFNYSCGLLISSKF